MTKARYLKVHSAAIGERRDRQTKIGEWILGVTFPRPYEKYIDHGTWNAALFDRFDDSSKERALLRSHRSQPVDQLIFQLDKI